jgi:gliding motility-associated-like protein
MLPQLFKISLNLQKTIFFWFLFFYLIVPTFSANTNHSLINNSQSNEVSQSLKHDKKPTSFSSYNTDYKLIPPTIVLTVVPFEARIALISWTTNDPVMNGIYYLERDASASGSWTLIAQFPYNTASLKYSDTISFPYCTPTSFSYRVRFESNPTGNDATSNLEVALLSDKTNPENVTNEIVSINLNTKPEIKWTSVVGDDIMGYRIDRFNGFSWDSIATQFADSTHFVDKSVTDGCNKSYAYVIITLDGCGLRSAPSYLPKKETINLEVEPIKECERLAKLSWNTYSLMPGSLGGYNVYRRINYGPKELIATITDTLVTNYTDSANFINGYDYTYFIDAFSANGTGTSSSCVWSWKYVGYNVPDSIYITSASVQDDSFVRISFHSLPDSTVKKLILERSLDLGLTFTPIDSLVFATDFIPEDFFIDDASAEVHTRSYDYRLVAIDYCGTRKILSNVSRSICLKCEGYEASNDLFWNTYQTWQKGVSGYEVFRTLSGLPTNGETIGNINAGSNTLSDPLTSIDPNKKACYWVVASENPGNPYLSKATSLSNTCCINKAASLFMPNAFCPEGINNRYRPVALYVNPVSFTMTIFNRWGQQIFETTDLLSGWDGRTNKELSPVGLYAYIIKYSSVGGQEYTKRGTFLLVR